MASIESYRTKDGLTRYMVRYRKPDNTPTKKRGFKRKRDAVEWMSANTLAIRSGDYVDPMRGRATVRDVHERWECERRPHWKPATIRIREASWRLHIEPEWGDRQIASIRASEIQASVAVMSGRYSRPTVAGVTAVWHGIARTALRDGLIARDFMSQVDIPRDKRIREERRYLTVRQLLDLAETASHGRYRGMDHRDMIILLGLCGLRWHEMCALRKRDVDFDRNRIHICRSLSRVGRSWVETSPKSGLARDVPMPGMVRGMLADRCSRLGPDDRVFTGRDGGVPKSQSSTGRGWWATALRNTGLEPMRVHDLRHTAASIAVHAGANVKALQRMLGHASAAMTLDVYADLFDSDLDDVASIIDATISVECAQNVPTDVSDEGSEDVETLESVGFADGR